MPIAKQKTPFPVAGDAYAFPLGDGRFSVCRVIFDASSKQSQQIGGKAIFAAVSSWIGSQPPSEDTPELRSILRLTHHNWNNERNVCWIVRTAVPTNFQPIEPLTPTAAEKALASGAGVASNWNALTEQALRQWRWDHDRAAVLKEDAASDAAAIKERRRQDRERKTYLRSVTLEKLRSHTFFRNWVRYPSKRFTQASRNIMHRTVADLAALEANANARAKLAILRQCIEAFNDLDERGEHVIETVEREDICEEFDVIVHACGLGRHKHLADRWRDW